MLSIALQIISAVGTMAILAVLINIASQLRMMGGQVERRFGLPGDTGTGQDHHGADEKAIGVFSIWTYEEERWLLVEGCGQPGCDCGPPPAQPGTYPGQVVRKECPAP